MTTMDYTAADAKKPAQFCLIAIAAVVLADLVGGLIALIQTLMLSYRVFSFSTLVSLFWTLVQYGLLVAAGGVLAWFVFKRMRDAAVAAAGFCLARVAVDAVVFLRILPSVGRSAYEALEVFKHLLLVGAATAALVVLIMMLRKWKAGT